MLLEVSAASTSKDLCLLRRPEHSCPPVQQKDRCRQRYLAIKQAENRAEDTSITGRLIRVLRIIADVLRSNATFEVLEAMMGN